MGIDIENDFEPHYIIPRDKQKIATALKKAAQKSDKIYFATDEDREGEAISWHLLQILKVSEAKTERIVFHEITKEAILNSLKKPRKIDLNLVDAQQGRRVLDRLVGYELSPFLWRKVAKGLSAGRVQSVAVRLVVEREREIEAFQSQEYWQILADLKTKKNEIFTAHLQKTDGKSLDKFHFTNKEQVDKVIKELEKTDFTISGITKKQTKKNPLPPYTTSTLQQDANRRLGFSAKQTMMLAQQLYEGVKLGSQGETGLITYMRTDSVSLSEKFLKEASDIIKEKYGPDYHEQKVFKTKSKNAQEAHEAIRPTNVKLNPEQIKEYLDSRQYKLYKLIWQRAVASQMKPALVNTVSVDITASKYTFRSTGAQIHFQGFLKIYPMQISENTLPDLTEKEKLYSEKIYGEQKFTQPPARYSEAGLVKALEQRGIGRPSTYAPTISTILARNYVTLEDKRLKPTEIGMLVNDVLVEHFPQIVDYNFTAKIESELDEIAMGKLRWQKVIKEFYKPFKENLTHKDETLNKKD
jgi:DNA topoisomerase-1